MEMDKWHKHKPLMPPMHTEMWTRSYKANYNCLLCVHIPMNSVCTAHPLNNS